jgi:hypothetical protein
MLDYNSWLPKYLKALLILGRTYNPTSEYTKTAMKCFIESLTQLLPDKYMSRIFANFIEMNVYTRNQLLTHPTIIKFFETYPDIQDVLYDTPEQFLTFCLQSEFTMFAWMYLLNSYIIVLLNKSGHNMTPLSFIDLRKQYDPDYLDKSDWGRPIWFIIHMSPLYASGECQEVYYNLKAMLSCLRFILPCPKCQLHLTDNLPKINIDECAESREKLFEATWKLHNIVNADLHKYQPSLQEARQYYNFK